MASYPLGGGVEVVVRKSMTKYCATIFCIVIETTFKKYFYNINVNLKLH